MQGIMQPSACLQTPRHVKPAVPTLSSRCVAGIGSCSFCCAGHRLLTCTSCLPCGGHQLVKCCCRRLSSNSCCRVCQTRVFGTESLRGSLLAQASKSHTYNVEVGCPQARLISEPSCLEPSQCTALLPHVFDACLAGNCTGPAGQPWACLHSRAQHACKEDRKKFKLESICRWRSQRRTHQTRL